MSEQELRQEGIIVRAHWLDGAWLDPRWEPGQMPWWRASLDGRHIGYGPTPRAALERAQRNRREWETRAIGEPPRERGGLT